VIRHLVAMLSAAMSRLALALSIAAAMVMPGAAAAQTNEDLLRELRELREELRGLLLDRGELDGKRWRYCAR
jgi:hypothetical protein